MRALRCSPASERTSIAVLLRIDELQAIAIRASVVGYHRSELDAMGRWAGSLDAMARAARTVEWRPTHTASNTASAE